MNVKNTLKRFLGIEKSPLDSELEYLKNNGLKIGKNFICYSDYPFDSLYPWLISVGDNVLISSNVRILSHDASMRNLIGYAKVGIVSIGDNVFIGANTTVLCDTRIGNNVIVGCGSVVTHDLAENGIFAGNPARYICSYDDFMKKHSQNLLKYKNFDKPWFEWKNAIAEEREQMRLVLQDGYGYVRE